MSLIGALGGASDALPERVALPDKGGSRREEPMARIAVVGAGAWGTALAVVAARAGHSVTLWGRDPAAVERMARERMNAAYLPGIALPATIRPTAAIDEVAGCRDGAARGAGAAAATGRPSAARPCRTAGDHAPRAWSARPGCA